MYQINFKQPIHVHFIGIGGISMSGLAEILLNEQFTVSGSDSKQSPLTTHLEEMGANIFYQQVPSNITDDIDVVVYTAAIKATNQELAEVIRKNLPLLSRAEFLGQLMTNYKAPIAVAGTHGKTTTTSMVSHILLEGDLNPTISVGGILKAIGGNIRTGSSDIFLTEACEYTNSFLHFSPKIGIILNVEADHMDFFKNIDEIRESFHKFAALLPADGALIINADIEHHEKITQNLDCRVITYGLNRDANYNALGMAFNEQGHASFDLLKNGSFLDRVSLSVTGEHNASNSLAAIALGMEFGIPLEKIKQGLSSFTGTDRRFEYKGTRNGFTVIDDYAHHPTEITATLTAARNYPHKEIWCVFQPHTYTRTKAFWDDFKKALSLADHVILTDIYAARETDTLHVSSQRMASELKDTGFDAYYLPSFKEVENFLIKNCTKGDLLITMGAGDVVNIGESLLNG